MLEKITEMLADQLKMDVASIDPEKNLKEDLGVDSLDLFEFIMACEEEFDVEIDTEEVSNFTNLNEVAAYLEKIKG
ncbi:acyl carrier protein 2 [Clostridium sp. CAG:411]|jgi:acyl carrier protein|nr:acyl carrier protein 2 [Clostridium sp. CAG:411]